MFLSQVYTHVPTFKGWSAYPQTEKRIVNWSFCITYTLITKAHLWNLISPLCCQSLWSNPSQRQHWGILLTPIIYKQALSWLSCHCFSCRIFVPLAKLIYIGILKQCSSCRTLGMASVCWPICAYTPGPAVTYVGSEKLPLQLVVLVALVSQPI